MFEKRIILRVFIIILFSFFLLFNTGAAIAVDVNIQTGGSFDWW
jgi:hypothetical protein